MVVEPHFVGRDDHLRNRGQENVERGKVGKLDQVRRVTPSAAKEVGLRGVGQIQETDAEFEGALICYALQHEIEGETETVRRRPDGSERVVKVAVALG